MKVFDFDNTIYKGESTFDFTVFVIRKKKSLIRYMPSIIRILFLYKICKMDIETFTKHLEKYSTIFLKNQKIIEELVEEFWEENIEKIYPHMLKRIHEKDAIITTSPDFLMKGIKDILPTENVLTTRLNVKKGQIEYLNFKENKVKNFQKHFGKTEIAEFYTDSYNDKPLMDISKKVFLVKNGTIKQIK